ncbi:MAG: hypothetical protein Q4A62_04400 [Eikenella sp.]|nr:hypothetical protein [Eikenella sp.]
MLLLANHADYSFGFEVQSPETQFIPWTLTYKKVIALPFVASDVPIDSDGEVVGYYYCQHPVRVGNILFPRFEFILTPGQRTDIAVRTYFAKSTKGATDGDYWRFHQELERNLPLRSKNLYPANNYSWFWSDTLSVILTHHKDRERQNLEISFSDERESPRTAFSN